MPGLVKAVLSAIGLISAVILTLLLLHVSRFWVWVGPWSNDGLFGLGILSPYGNMVNFWLAGSWLQDFDILIWGCGAFLLLSALSWFASKILR